MTDQITKPTTADELLAQIERNWTELDDAIAHLSGDQWLKSTAAAGWSARDHLAHLTSWEASVIGMLQDGRREYEGVGIDAGFWATNDVDAINEGIRISIGHLSLPELMQHRDVIHTRLITALAASSTEALMRPVSEFADGGGDDPMFDRIYWNTVDHYPRHRDYILAIVA